MGRRAGRQAVSGCCIGGKSSCLQVSKLGRGGSPPKFAREEGLLHDSRQRGRSATAIHPSARACMHAWETGGLSHHHFTTQDELKGDTFVRKKQTTCSSIRHVCSWA